MRSKSITFAILLSLLFYSSCGGKKATTKTDFNYSLSGLVTGTPMNGGLFVYAIQLDENTDLPIGSPLLIDLIDDAASIPFGYWQLHLVGYDGSTGNLWEGATYCGSVTPTVLDTNEIGVSVTINQTNCALTPFPEAIAAKQVQLAGGASGLAIWDTSTWDGATWGP